MNKLKLINKEETKDGIIEVSADRLVNVRDEDISFTVNRVGYSVALRKSGEFKDKGLFLSSEFDWVLGKDSMGIQTLVPLLKEGGTN